MRQYKRIAAKVVLCMLVVVGFTGAGTAADVNPGDLLVLSNENASRGVWSYSYNIGTGQYDKSTEQLFVDLSALSGVTEIAYGPDKNLYVVAGDVVKRYNGTTGAYMDDFITGVTSMKSIAFSPTGTAYVDSGKDIYERQPDGSMSVYTTVNTYSSMYRMNWGPDYDGDTVPDLYFIGNTWQTGVFVVLGPTDPGYQIAAPPAGYGLYEAFCFGPDKTNDGVPEIYAQGEYAGLQVVYHNGRTGASLGFFTAGISAYANDMMWGPDNKLYICNRVHGDMKVYDINGALAYSMFTAGHTFAIGQSANSVEFVPGTSSPGTIVGQITLDDYLGDPQYVLVKVELRNPGELAPIRTEKVQMNNLGNYSMPDVPVGNYDLAFKAANWLQKVVPNVNVVSAPDNTEVNATLLNGDLDGDNEVTTSDLSVTLK